MHCRCRTPVFGEHERWREKHRGPGSVTVEGTALTASKGGGPDEPFAGKASPTVRFSEPGEYLLHVTANDRSATVDVKIQHSTDDSVWADLITFTQVGVGAETAEAKTVSGTVNRYVRAARTVAAGTGSITYAVGFARRVF